MHPQVFCKNGAVLPRDSVAQWKTSSRPAPPRLQLENRILLQKMLNIDTKPSQVRPSLGEHEQDPTTGEGVVLGEILIRGL